VCKLEGFDQVGDLGFRARARRVEADYEDLVEQPGDCAADALDDALEVLGLLGYRP